MAQDTGYDLQNRPRIGPRHLRRLRALGEDLARDFAAALSSLLRTAADVNCAGVDQLACGQFVDGIETPACFCLLKAEPLAGRLMLDIEPSILHPMIDRLLGGDGDDELPGRPLTEIDWCLTARIVRPFLQACRRAWQSVVDLKLDILQMESNPRLLRILPADETVVVLTFELAIGRQRGMMRLCLPCRAVEQIGDKLLLGNREPINPPSDAAAEVKVTLAETSLAADQLADLRAGDIIATETAVDSPAIVSIDGAAKFLAKPGVYQGRRAVRLVEAIENPKSSLPSDEDS